MVLQSVQKAGNLLIMLVKNIFTLGLTFFMLFVFSDSSAKAQEHIQTSWGMKKDRIIELMGEDPVMERRDMIVYEGVPIGNLMTTAGFIFNRRDRLEKKTYVFHLNYQDPLQYVVDKVNLKSQLDNIYGKVDTEVKWSDYQYANQADLLGKAVTAGHAEIITVWYNMETIIVLSLRGKDGDARLVLEMMKN